MKALISLPKGARDGTFFTSENIALAESLGTIIWNEKDVPMTRDEVLECIEDCDVYVTLWGSPRLDDEILARAGKLKLLTHLAGTVVPFVSDAMWQRGVRVLSGNSYFAQSVAEGTIGYILSALRDIPRYSRRLKQQRLWQQNGDWYEGLRGKTIGLVSYGEIARFLVPLLHPFGVTIKVYDIVPLPKEDVEKYGLIAAGLEDIFSTCDVISLHTPLYDKTYHMIDERLLRMIRPGALFVNTSRGAIVDQRALERELAGGRFRAVLDVYEEEPPLADNPLYGMDNVLMMPHMGGPTIDLHRIITRDLLIESANFVDSGAPLVHEITQQRARFMSLS